MLLDLGNLFVLLFAVLPGFPAYWLFGVFYGRDWRQNYSERLVPIVLISLAGLIVYIFAASKFQLPSPVYLFPSTFQAENFNETSLPTIATAVLGHFLCSILIVLSVIGCLKLSNKWLPNSPHPAAWDEFVRSLMPKRWVLVALSNGDVYIGSVKAVDTSVNQKERDLVLSEPAVYDESAKKYIATPYQYIFLAAELVYFVGALSDSDIDKRLTEIGEPIFVGGNRDEQE